MDFIRRYIEQTETYLLPHAGDINADMGIELADLLESRRQLLVRP